MKKEFNGKISAVSDEAEGIKKFVIEFKGNFSFIPGQYVMLSFPDNSNLRKAFSIVSANNNQLVVYIKKNGEFTTRLFSLGIGERINIFGPYGRFVLSGERKNVVFIAGGIGITPLYSIMSDLLEKKYSKPVFLYYSCKTKSDMAFFNELNKINQPNFKISLFFTQEGSMERISVAKIMNDIAMNDTVFYLCGPVNMMNSIRDELLHAGIDQNSIMQEQFG